MTYLFGDRDRRPVASGGQTQARANHTPTQSNERPMQQAPLATPSQTKPDVHRPRPDHIDLLDLQQRPEPVLRKPSSTLAGGATFPLVGAQAGNGPFLLQKLAELKLRNESADDLPQEQVLELALEAAELNMKFMKLANSKREKADRRVLSSALLDEAEQIKRTPAATWTPSKVQNLIDMDPIDPIPTPPAQPARVPGPSALPTSSPSVVLASPVSSQTTVSSRDLPAPIMSNPSRREEILLWTGAQQLRGGPFPPWLEDKARDVKHAAFAATAGLYTDMTDLGLSPAQLSLLDDWQRPLKALPPPSIRSHGKDSGSEEDKQATMSASKPIDLVQDAATNCSLVASMCSGVARNERGFSDLISRALHPWDETLTAPSMSPNGKYIVRLNFNGCFRKVVIDDRLPVSKNERLLHVVDRKNPGLLWPALIEKAYMKIRGGFDFPGSNSCTDLWTLTGWVPEQCHLHHDETDMDALWKKIHKSFAYGDVLITVGTGRLTPASSSATGLVSEHAYAVLDLRVDNGTRKMLIKNPWMNGTKWKGRFSEAIEDPPDYTSVADDDDDYKSAVDGLNSRSPSPADDSTAVDKDEKQQSGPFWMKLSDVMQNFDTLYLNWNPGLFKHRKDAHFEWDLSSDRGPIQNFRTNPQYAIASDVDETVWVLLSRHFKDVARVDGKPQYDEEFISLYAYEGCQGKRVIVSKGASKRGPYVDCNQTLMKLDMTAGVSITIAVVAEGLRDSKHPFTLSAFTRHPFSMREAKEQFSDQVTLTGTWNRDNSGIPSTSALYRKNLQYMLFIPAVSKVAVLLETLVQGVNVNVRIFHGDGKRMHHFHKQDIIADTGKYKPACCLAAIDEPLPTGGYTIIVGTNETHEHVPFKLHVFSNVNTSLNPCQREGAGRIRQRLADVSFPPYSRKMTAPIVPSKHVMLYFEATLAQSASAGLETTSSPVRLTVELGRGPDRLYLIASAGGMFKDASGGVRTEDLDLSPPMVLDRWGGHIELNLVLERMGGDFGVQNKPEERFHIDAYSDTFNWAAMGVWRSVHE